MTNISSISNDETSHTKEIPSDIQPSYMKRFYSRDEIKDIKNHIEQYGVKKYDNIEAFKVLLLSQFYLLGGLFMITIQFHIGVALTTFSLMRLFMIFHDACHNSFFYSPKDNIQLGKWIQYMFPWTYEQWRDGHGTHHFVFGNKNETDPAASVITKKQYMKMGSREKWIYRVVRDPFIFFWIIPVYLMVKSFHHRSWKSGLIWYSKFGVCWMIGGQFLWGCILSLYFGLVLGMIMFHLQHTVNVGFLEGSNHKNSYHMRNHALLGASMLKIPIWLKWATLGIEYHHIHHFSTRVPSYKLRKCHEAGEKREMWIRVPHIGYRKAIASLLNVYFNEENGLYETFDEYKSLGRFIQGIGNVGEMMGIIGMGHISGM